MTLPRHHRPPHIACVFLTASGSQSAFLRNICGLASIRVHRAATLEDADFLLMATDSTVLLSDVIAVDCSWRSALTMLQDHYPHVQMVVIADPVQAPFVGDVDLPGLSGIVWRPVQFHFIVGAIRDAHQAATVNRAIDEDRSGIDAGAEPKLTSHTG